MTTTSKEEVSFLARHFPLRSDGLFMAWLSSLKKQQSRRVLKRSDPLLFREMTQGSSMRRLLLRDVLGTYPVFSERMSKRSRRLARYHLAMVLFQSPLAERGMTVSVSPRSPAVIPVAKGDK
jgi:hypothetical protein